MFQVIMRSVLPNLRALPFPFLSDATCHTLPRVCPRPNPWHCEALPLKLLVPASLRARCHSSLVTVDKSSSAPAFTSLAIIATLLMTDGGTVLEDMLRVCMHFVGLNLGHESTEAGTAVTKGLLYTQPMDKC